MPEHYNHHDPWISESREAAYQKVKRSRVRNNPDDQLTAKQYADLKNAAFNMIYGNTVLATPGPLSNDDSIPVGTSIGAEAFHLLGFKPSGRWVRESNTDLYIKVSTITPNTESENTAVEFDTGYNQGGSYTKVDGEWYFASGDGVWTKLSERGNFNVVFVNGGKFQVDVGDFVGTDNRTYWSYTNVDGDEVRLNYANLQSVTTPKFVANIRAALSAKKSDEVFLAELEARKADARKRKVEAKREENAIAEEASSPATAPSNTESVANGESK